jgi:hypothetical protein
MRRKESKVLLLLCVSNQNWNVSKIVVALPDIIFNENPFRVSRVATCEQIDRENWWS